MKSIQKAGLVPYAIFGNEYKYMFMIPSDSEYGGDRPQIAKGYVDHGESLEHAACREAKEELGVRLNNMIGNPMKCWSGDILGYQLTVYAVEVRWPNAFDKPHYETGSTMWLTAEEFAKLGKVTQLPIMQTIAQRLSI